MVLGEHNWDTPIYIVDMVCLPVDAHVRSYAAYTYPLVAHIGYILIYVRILRERPSVSYCPSPTSVVGFQGADLSWRANRTKKPIEALKGAF